MTCLICWLKSNIVLVEQDSKLGGRKKIVVRKSPISKIYTQLFQKYTREAHFVVSL